MRNEANKSDKRNRRAGFWVVDCRKTTDAREYPIAVHHRPYAIRDRYGTIPGAYFATRKQAVAHIATRRRAQRGE